MLFPFQCRLVVESSCIGALKESGCKLALPLCVDFVLSLLVPRLSWTENGCAFVRLKSHLAQRTFKFILRESLHRFVQFSALGPLLCHNGLF